MDLADIDENGKPLLFFGETTVEMCHIVDGQDNFILLTKIRGTQKKLIALNPEPTCIF